MITICKLICRKLTHCVRLALYLTATTDHDAGSHLRDTVRELEVGLRGYPGGHTVSQGEHTHTHTRLPIEPQPIGV